MWKYINPPRSDELYHFGILGMKWGKRRTDAQLGKKSVKSSETQSEGVDFGKIGKRVDALRGTPEGRKLAEKRLKAPREEPMFKWSDEEIDKFSADFDKGKKEITKKYMTAKTDSERMDAFVEEFNLESHYLYYAEWD